jgi:hypothetical protein
MSAVDIATTEAFLRYVHEPAIVAGVDGRVVISARQPDGAPSRYLSISYPLDQLDEAAAGAHRISRSEMNGFCRVHLMERPLDRPTERGKSVDTRYVTHFAADVDIAGPGHKPAEGQILPPDVDAAVALIDATLPPSAIILSGGGPASGLYPIWRLSEVVEAETDEDRRRIEVVGRRFDRALASHGYHVDPTVKSISPASFVRQASRTTSRAAMHGRSRCCAATTTVPATTRSPTSNDYCPRCRRARPSRLARSPPARRRARVGTVGDPRRALHDRGRSRRRPARPVRTGQGSARRHNDGARMAPRRFVG